MQIHTVYISIQKNVKSCIHIYYSIQFILRKTMANNWRPTFQTSVVTQSFWNIRIRNLEIVYSQTQLCHIVVFNG